MIYYMKQNKKQKQALESAQHGLEISFKVVHTSKYGDVQEKFHVLENTRFKTLEHFMKHFETILPNLPLGECEI